MRAVLNPDSVDARDEALTYDLLARLVEQKELELEESKGLADSVREEYERSLSYRIGRFFCRGSR